MDNKPLMRSVDSLRTIYGVIIALAIGKALQEVFEGVEVSTIGPHLLELLPPLLSFFVIVVPFYQGMNRHLDICYVERAEYKKFGLLFDFFCFSIEASLMFVFANLITLGALSFLVLGIILVVDVFWGLIAHLINYHKLKKGVIIWSAVNFVTVAVGVFIYAFKGILAIDIPWLFFSIAIIRTVVDYSLMKDYYFP